VDVTGIGDGVAVGASVGVWVDGIRVLVGVNGLDGEQAVMHARSVKRVMICFVHRIASLIHRIASPIA
jgi:hypothetical protein